jgi:DNA-directed RNA polymerase alpha subunit
MTRPVWLPATFQPVPPVVQWTRRPVSALGLSVAQSYALHEAGYKTLGEVFDASDTELIACKGIATGTVAKIREALSRWNEGT